LLLLFCPASASQWRRVGLIVSVPLLTAALIASTARGPVLCFGLVFLLSMVFRPIRANLPATKASFPILCLGLLAIAGSVYWLQQQDAAGRKLNRKVGELEEILGGSSNPTYTAGMRLARYRNALDMFSQKPLMG